MDKLLELLIALKRNSFRASLVMLVTSLGVSGMVALIPPVRDVALTIVKNSTELSITKKEGKMSNVDVFPSVVDGGLHLQMAPCSKGEAMCFVEISTRIGTTATWGITTVALGLLLFFVFGFVLYNAREPSSLIAGRLIEIEYNIDRDEKLTYKATYHDIKVLNSKRTELYMPIQLNASAESQDESVVGIESFRILSKSDSNTIESPRFKPGKLYEGKLEFSKGATSAKEVVIQFVATKLFSLNRRVFRKRWKRDDGQDTFTWESTAYWEEISLKFNWEIPPHIEGVPQVKYRRMIGALEEDVDSDEWNPGTWALHVKNVTPGQQFVFRWELTEQFDSAQPSS